MKFAYPQPHLFLEAAALDAHLALLEAEIYRQLAGLAEHGEALAAHAQSCHWPAQALRAQLLASDARSRMGHAQAELPVQLALHEAAQAWPGLACRAATYLISSCDRAGLRVEAMRWAERSLVVGDVAEPWYAEALMVTALFSSSRAGADFGLVERAMAAVRGACLPVMVAASAANFAEVASECGQTLVASAYADEAEAMMRRHPEAAAVLTWESVARARLAAQELFAAEHAMKEALRLEAELGCCDVNGDPWISYAELLLAREEPAQALAMLEAPRRLQRTGGSPYSNTRALRARAEALAALQRWEEAYLGMVAYAAAYEKLRAVEADQTGAESSAVAAALDERKRAQHFEKLALTDALTGLPNRRQVELWLGRHDTARANPAQAVPLQLCLGIVDLDHFKHINDHHSHDAGDLVLKRVGQMLAQLAGDSGAPAAPTLAARLGGEEFLLAWTGVSLEDALQSANAWRETLRQTSFADLVGNTPVTASIGLAFGQPTAPPNELLRAADACLYQAKRAGRDRVVGVHLWPVAAV